MPTSIVRKPIDLHFIFNDTEKSIKLDACRLPCLAYARWRESRLITFISRQDFNNAIFSENRQYIALQMDIFKNGPLKVFWIFVLIKTLFIVTCYSFFLSNIRHNHPVIKWLLSRSLSNIFTWATILDVEHFHVATCRTFSSDGIEHFPVPPLWCSWRLLSIKRRCSFSSIWAITDQLFFELLSY